MVCLTGVLAVTWIVLWRRRVVFEEARRRDAARIRPARFIDGMARMDEAIRDRTARRRANEAQALEVFTRELRSGKPRLHKVS